MTTDTQSPPPQTANPYLRTQVLTATPEKLRLLLLEGALRFLHQGREGLVRRDYNASYDGLSQARGIVVELMSSMKPDAAPELCARVQSLYTFIFKLIAEASLEKEPAKADKAIELLEFERETWVLAMEKLAEDRNSGRTGPVTAAAARPERPVGISVQG